MKKSPGFVAAVMELLVQEIPFVYLHFDRLKYAWTMAKRFCVSAIICDCNLNFCPLSFIFETKELAFVYGTKTSGTTGEPKSV
uniref:Uncharacterized protein n=1 Tax=Panagrolaimus sp. ES5 TaxID=591445 RepID=A0AC34GWB0_9BILA